MLWQFLKHPARCRLCSLLIFYLSLSRDKPIQSMSLLPISQRSILILSSNLSLGLPCGILPLFFPTKTLYSPLLSPIRATCLVHLIFLEMITRANIWWGVQSINFHVMWSSQTPCHLIPLRYKNVSQQLILAKPQPMFLPQFERPTFIPTYHQGKFKVRSLCDWFVTWLGSYGNELSAPRQPPSWRT